ncbi:MAG TPA: protease pro-enzyme activation domain-containing protein [Acidimicrobiales bacterium]|nr:protease pro-enzyme activation domain-containing protein [Acidimicrobiales bacterium]
MKHIALSRRTAASLAVIVALLSTFAVAAPGAVHATAPDAVIVNNVLRSIAHLQPVGTTDPSKEISIGVGLTGRDPAGEDAYLAGEYDPTSALYGQYLSPTEFEQRFGVPSDRLSQVTTWLSHAGLQVQAQPNASEYVLATGTVAQVAGLLHVTFKDYRAGSLAFYANTNAPTVPSDLGVYGINGLNSLEGPRLQDRAKPATPSPTANLGLSTPSALWSIYDQPGGNKGEGQQMAIFGWGTTKNTLDDLRQFEVENKLPAIPLSIRYSGNEKAVTDSGGEEEWNIDTQASTGMAPNAVAEKLYFGKAGTDPDLVGAYNAWAGDEDGPLQGSSSFGGCEEAPGTDGLSGSPGSPSGVVIAGNPNQDLYEKVLKKAVMEGRTMFASSGDTGAGCPAVALVLNGVTLVPTPMLNYPAVSTHAVAVGGTVLYYNDATATSPATRSFEYSWHFTGGGNSDFIAADRYQNTNPPVLQTRCVTDPHGQPYSPPLPYCRGIPDVAAQSGDVLTNGYAITAGGQNDQPGGGTSLSSPLWLGMWTRIQAASRRFRGAGFANPAIYRTASDATKYAKDFFDVGGVSTETTVTCNGVTPLNCSHPGWDYTSGWGVPDVKNLMFDIDGTTTPRRMTHPNPPPTTGGGGGPVVTGTTCPGPQMIDKVGDAPNNYPGGDGSNMDNLDIVNASFSSPDAATLRVTMTLKDLEPPPPPVNAASALWAVTWTYNGTQYTATATVNGAGPAAVWGYDDGTKAVKGTSTLGPNGTIVMEVPLADVGNPPAGASIVQPFADSRGSFTLLGSGLRYTAAADRAPDGGVGAPWVIGKTC